MENVIQVQFPDHFKTNYKAPLPNEEEMKTALKETGPVKIRKRVVRENCAGLYWYPRLKTWKRGNKVSFNPETRVALSYDWWEFVKPIGGKLVFNSYRYSVTTTSHQYTLRWFLKQQGIKIDLEIESPDGLQKLESALWHYERKIRLLREAIANKGSRKAKNAERITEIESLQRKIFDVHGLMRLDEVSNA